MGNPEWTKESKFADLSGRLQNVDELDQNIEAWTRQYDADVVMHTFQAVGVAASTVQRAQDVIKDPQLQWRGAIEEMAHPVSGNRLYPGTPFNMPDMEFPPNRPAPILGQHTEEICREELNLSEAEIEALKSEQVLEVPA